MSYVPRVEYQSKCERKMERCDDANRILLVQYADYDDQKLVWSNEYAGFILVTPGCITIEPGEKVIIDIGMGIGLKAGYSCWVVGASCILSRNISVTEMRIQSKDYTMIKLTVQNLSATPQYIDSHSTVAVLRVSKDVVTDINVTYDRLGGCDGIVYMPTN